MSQRRVPGYEFHVASFGSFNAINPCPVKFSGKDSAADLTGAKNSRNLIDPITQ